jgi:uncharacterized membrane protein
MHDTTLSETSGAPRKSQGVATGFEVNAVTLDDLKAIVSAGIADLSAAPLLSLGIASIYTLGGWQLVVFLLVLKLPYLVYPLAMGFALIAPFVAVAFYAVSRALERGEVPTAAKVWAAVAEASRRQLRWMAVITSFAFVIWMDLAAMLTLSVYGADALDMRSLLHEITTTTSGWLFLVAGHIAGAVIALLIFSISVVTYPMLYDQDIDVMTAMATSVRLVQRNPVTMALWCAIIAVSMAAAIASGLLLLPLVLPVLGYASWHLYRRAVRAVAPPAAASTA